jgi:deazaflavin-dependent oxidoreductase (nitroreductase family)
VSIRLNRGPDASGCNDPYRDTNESSIPFCRKPYHSLVRPAVKVVARIHLGLLRSCPGNLRHRFFGDRVVLLTTVGRRSGRAWTTPLAYMRHGDSLVVAASCGGSDRPPDWWLNLQCQPLAVVEISGIRSPVHAHMAENNLLSRLTPEFEESFPQMHFYKKMSTREIPLIVLQPTPGAEVGYSAF